MDARLSYLVMARPLKSFPVHRRSMVQVHTRRQTPAERNAPGSEQAILLRSSSRGGSLGRTRQVPERKTPNLLHVVDVRVHDHGPDHCLNTAVLDD